MIVQFSQPMEEVALRGALKSCSDRRNPGSIGRRIVCHIHTSEPLALRLNARRTTRDHIAGTAVVSNAYTSASRRRLVDPRHRGVSFEGSSSMALAWMPDGMHCRLDAGIRKRTQQSRVRPIRARGRVEKPKLGCAIDSIGLASVADGSMAMLSPARNRSVHMPHTSGQWLVDASVGRATERSRPSSSSERRVLRARPVPWARRASVCGPSVSADSSELRPISFRRRAHSIHSLVALSQTGDGLIGVAGSGRLRIQPRCGIRAIRDPLTTLLETRSLPGGAVAWSPTQAGV